MKNTRNILLIGRTGSGKSTLANMLIGENIFKESSGSVSETKNIQEGTFEVKIDEASEEKITYRVIDTVGIGDTKLSKEETLKRFQEIAPFIYEHGLNQILFVTDGRFKEEEIMAYDLLRSVIFDSNVAIFTTIVRTKFENFRNQNKCKEDKKLMIRENNETHEILTSCGNRFIHVNNPSINISPADGEDEEEKKDREDEIKASIKKRKASRKILLEHLETCQEIYFPELLVNFKKAVNEFNLTIKDFEKEINDNSKIFDNNIEQIERFLIERERVIEELEKYISSTNSFESPKKNLIEEEEKKNGELSQSWINLIEKNKNFEEKVNDVHFRFNKSEYKNQEINKEKTKIVEEVIRQAQTLQFEPK